MAYRPVLLLALISLWIPLVLSGQDLCGGSSCSFAGTCFEQGEFKICECNPGRSGFQCQYSSCTESNCYNHGMCDGSGNCICNPGFLGPACEVPRCPAGAYFNVDSAGCTDCPKGYYQYDTGALLCILAEPGTLTVDMSNKPITEGAVNSIACPAGYECPDFDLVVPCLAGSASAEGDSDCEPCPPGTANSETMKSNCTDCPQGKYSSIVGGLFCSAVPNGHYATRGTDINLDGIVDAVTSGASAHLPCPTGRYCQNGLFMPCPAGTMPNVDRTTCVSCPAHTYAPAEATGTCLSCSTDSYAPVGSTTCYPIPPGYTRGTSGLDLCPVSSACAGGASPVTLCSAGRVPDSNRSSCIPCSNGQYTADNEVCLTCSKQDEISIDGVSCIEAFDGCQQAAVYSAASSAGRRIPELPQPSLVAYSSPRVTYNVTSSIDIATYVFPIGTTMIEFRAAVPGNPVCTTAVTLFIGTTIIVDNIGYVRDEYAQEIREHLVSDTAVLGGELLQSIDITDDSFSFWLIPQGGISFTFNNPSSTTQTTTNAAFNVQLSYCQASALSNDSSATTYPYSGQLFIEPSMFEGVPQLSYSETCFSASFHASIAQIQTLSFPGVRVKLAFATTTPITRGVYVPNGPSGVWFSDSGDRFTQTDETALVTAYDTDPPRFIYCPAAINVSLLYEMSSAVVEWSSAIATDNIEVVKFESTATSGSTLNLRDSPISVTYTADDAADNERTCTFEITLDYPHWVTNVQLTVVNFGQEYEQGTLDLSTNSIISYISILPGAFQVVFPVLEMTANQFRWTMRAESKYQFRVNPSSTEVALDLFVLYQRDLGTSPEHQMPLTTSDAYIRVEFENLRDLQTNSAIQLDHSWFSDKGTVVSSDTIMLRGSAILPAQSTGLLFTAITIELSLPGLRSAAGATTEATTISTETSSTTLANTFSNSSISSTVGPSNATTPAPIHTTTPSDDPLEALADVSFKPVTGHVRLTRLGLASSGAPLFAVVGVDLIAPTISCPSDQTFVADPGMSSVTVDRDSLQPTMSDNSGTVYLVTELNTTFSIGEHNVTLTASDSYGNTASCTFDVAVRSSQSSTTSNSTGLSPAQVGGLLGGLIVLIVIIVGALWRRRVARLTRPKPYDFEERLRELAEHLRGEDGLIRPREIKREHIRQLDILGSGNWGQVAKGILEEHKQAGLPGFLVAIKMLKTTNIDSQDELMREAAFMAQLNNDFVVKLHGVCTFDGPLMMVMEYCEHGSLQAYLRDHDMSPRYQLQVLGDAASGLMYLASRGVVHRDVASRNVLLSSEWRGRIADFGMSRESEAESAYYHSRGGAVPVRWSAPEALEHHKFSEKSDVWSFGILCHEMYTKAELPYSGWSNQKVWVSVMDGYRLPQANSCPDFVYAMMMQCWATVASNRPTFSTIVTAFNERLADIPNSQNDVPSGPTQQVNGKRPEPAQRPSLSNPSRPTARPNLYQGITPDPTSANPRRDTLKQYDMGDDQTSDPTSYVDLSMAVQVSGDGRPTDDPTSYVDFSTAVHVPRDEQLQETSFAPKEDGNAYVDFSSAIEQLPPTAPRANRAHGPEVADLYLDIETNLGNEYEEPVMRKQDHEKAASNGQNKQITSILFETKTPSVPSRPSVDRTAIDFSVGAESPYLEPVQQQ
eukprot:m.124683 g.124683  ORF g.124683 m.124683 type:complete len:1648 (+) comp15598_c3_seq1:166-5109(+)